MRARFKIFCSIMTIAIFFAMSGIVISFALNMSKGKTLAHYYVSNGVEAYVYGNYYVGSRTYQMLSGESDHVVFSGDAEDTQESLSPAEDQIDLSTGDGFVVFEYQIINRSESKDFSVDLIATPTVNNMKVTYAYSFDKLENYNEIVSSDFIVTPVLAGEGSTTYIYIKVAIDNLANNASYVGTFSFRFSTCDIYEVTLENENGFTDILHAIYGEEVESVDVPEFEDKTFMGYFTERNGQGEQIIDENGHFNDIWLVDTDTTLYAYYI